MTAVSMDNVIVDLEATCWEDGTTPGHHHRALDDALNIAQLAALILPVLKP